MSENRLNDSDERLVDLSRPVTFGRMEGFDVIVNCADARGANAVAAMLHSAKTGLCFLDAGANQAHMRQAQRALAAEGNSLEGVTVLGVGLFPGLSNIFARHVWQTAPAESLTLCLRSNVLSRGGRGMARLMADTLTSQAVFFEGDVRQTTNVKMGARIAFSGRLRRTLLVGLAEATMLNQSSGIRNIKTY